MDRLGRRTLLIWSAAACSFCMVVSIYLHLSTRCSPLTHDPDDFSHARYRHNCITMGLRGLLLHLLRCILLGHSSSVMDVRFGDHASPDSQQRRRTGCVNTLAQQLRRCLCHTSVHREPWIQTLHHLGRVQCQLRAHHVAILP